LPRHDGAQGSAGQIGGAGQLGRANGACDRRQFDERLRDQWARAKRDGTPLSLLLIDVDHFKKFNDPKSLS
jgi:GGDEF domain-containing protein